MPYIIIENNTGVKGSGVYLYLFPNKEVTVYCAIPIHSSFTAVPVQAAMLDLCLWHC